MTGIKRRLGSLLGPEGRVPQLVEGTTTQLPPSEPAKVELIKTGDARYRVDAQVPRGLDGDPTAVADFGEAMAAEIVTQQSVGRSALNAATSEIAVTRKPLVFDTFTDVPDGELPTISDSGHAWNYFNENGLEVQDGLLSVRDGEGGSYTEINLGNPVTRIGCTFIIDSEGGVRTEGGGVSLNSWNDGGVSANGGGRRSRAHVDMTRTTLGWGIRETEGAGQPINVTGGRYRFAKPLPLDEWLTFEWYIQGNKGVVLCPDGSIHTVEDDLLLSLDDTFACWQIFGPSSQSHARTKLGQIWADSAPDSPDDAQALSFEAAHKDLVLRPAKGLRTIDSEGNEREIIVHSNNDTVILKNEAAPESDRNDFRVLADGVAGIFSAKTSTPHLRVHPDGMVQIRGHLAFTSSGHGIMLGSGSPEGNLHAAQGVLYIDRSAGRGMGLWQRDRVAPNNTGWEQVGHPSGTTSQRVKEPTTGLSYFDQTLGRPIWWNGSAWVDAMGETV